MWRVKVDLAYRVAYLLDERGVDQAAQSGVTRSTVGGALASWGYALTRDGAWEPTDILNAIDAVQHTVEQVGT
jgi:hypothetical protein